MPGAGAAHITAWKRGHRNLPMPAGANNLGTPVFPDGDLSVHVYAFMGADPTASSGSWPSPVDLTSRLLDVPMQIRRGRSSGQKTLSSGSCTFTLDNSDGQLTPLLATSSYYGQWDLGTPVAIAVDGVGSAPPYRRFCGYVASIEQTVIPGVGGYKISVVKVTLGGVLRRMTQGSVAKSAMRRFYENVSPQPVAYWPLESGDKRGALTFQSGLSGGSDLVVAQSTFYGVTRPFSAAGGVTPGPPGAASATDTHAGGFLIGPTTVVPSATQARGEISMLADGFENGYVGIVGIINGLTASDGLPARIEAATQPFGGVWKVGVGWAGPAGTGLDYPSDGLALQDNQWHFVQMDIASANAGADTSYTLRVDGVTVISGTATGYTWNPPVSARTNPLSTDLDQVAHFAIWAGTSLPTAADSYDAFLSHPGEAAHTRFARVCAEDGVPCSVTATESRAVGPQPVSDLPGILVDLEAVDHGVLSELAGDWGFGYLAASERYNAASVLTIDLATYRSRDDLGSVLVPIRNDARVRNEWTITNSSGSSATASDTADQAVRGRYDDSATVNVETAAAALDEASWRVLEGTVNITRYRAMPMDAAANTASPSDLLRPWISTELGDVLVRTGNPTPEHPYGDAVLTLEGYTETIGRRSWKVDTVVEPFDVWHVQQLAATTPTDFLLDGWLVPDSLTLHTTVDATATSWSVDISPLMSTTASEFPARAWCEGELITMTACSGGSSPQTWTVVRSGNGVSKAHTAGVAITLADPLILIP